MRRRDPGLGGTPQIILAGLAMPAACGLSDGKAVAHRAGSGYGREAVALVGAVVAFLAALVAYFAPFPKDIRPLMPVLRTNIWLAIHVMTITAGYGAALLAWGLGNVALVYYLLGRYRPGLSARDDPARRR